MRYLNPTPPAGSISTQPGGDGVMLVFKGAYHMFMNHELPSYLAVFKANRTYLPVVYDPCPL